MPRSDFQEVIGLEVHAQLLTDRKLFAAAMTSFGGAPNSHVTPLCLGMPGTLPVPNEEAVRLAVAAGLALHCTVNEVSEWSRKHYFYPDLPKGYQITQYDRPICEWGYVDFRVGEMQRRIRIRRIHIEEDAGKSTHDSGRALSLIDLNRAGTPLIEIVSEPDGRSSDDAVEYLKALREILVFIGVNDGNLEEGSFRCDANVSVMRRGSTTLGTRTELKNINSFRNVKAAIEIEIDRQIEILEQGGAIAQETRLFDAQRNETRAMRSKEDAHDYRYFPDPDLPLLVVSQSDIVRAREALPELPEPRRQRFKREFGLPDYDIGVLTSDRWMAQLFEACVAKVGDAKKVSNWFMGELLRLLNEARVSAVNVKFSAAQFADLLALIERGSISQNAGKEVFGEMFRTGRDAREIVAERGLEQVSDVAEIERLIDGILAANPKTVEQYRAGKTQLAGFFVGQVMKAMAGKGNPKIISDLIAQKLK